MKKAFQKLSRRGDPKPGSSQAPKIGTNSSADDLPQLHISAQTFLNEVNTLVTGTDSTGTGEEHIRDLVGTIGPAIFSVAIAGALQNNVQNFWVGAHNLTENKPGRALEGTRTCNKVRFASTEVLVFNPKVKIPLAVPVLTIKADKLDISGSNGNLESFRFKREDYTTVDLETYPSARCLFVLTSQLSGCSFVIGCRGTQLYMGHAQALKGVAFADTGEQVAASLKLKRETMFQDVENQLESTFLVGAGSEFKIDEIDRIITYDPRDHYLNVIGLVCNRKFYCILATKDGSEKIKNVALVTLDTDATRKWKTEEMPRTW